MQEVSPSRVSIRIGAFEVDLRAGELRKQGVKVKLQEQPFQVLQVLLAQPGEVVSREELQRRIWPSDTFVGFDQGLYNAVKRLREALGDTADTPRFIETLPKRGYRFIAAVNGNGHASICPVPESPVISAQGSIVAPPVQEAPFVAAVPTIRRRWNRALGAGLALVVLIGVFVVAAPVGVASNFRRWFSSRTNLPAIHSLAVLPLQNLSGDPAQEYFADGMTDELITELSGISALKVISRTSVMRYKKSDKSLPEIARDLHVDGIVEGSVVRDGNAVRITAQLIYAPEDKNVWARSFERQFQDSLALQSEIATAIAGAVRAQIEPAEQTRLQTARPVNPKALEAYLLGRYHSSRYGYGYGSEEFEKAKEYFHQAIAEDPGFARAYAALGDRASLEKALSLDPNLSSAHESLAEEKRDNWDWLGAEQEFRRALELDPNNALAHKEFGDFLIDMGRVREGLDEDQWAQELDPNHSSLFMGLYSARQYDRHLAHVTEFLARTPSDAYLHYWLAMNYAHRGMHKEAIEHFKSSAALIGLRGLPEAIDRGYATSGFSGAMRAIAKYLSQARDWEGIIPVAYALAGDKEQALNRLQKCYEERNCSGFFVGIGIDPVWDPLRSDPRFEELVRRLGLPEINVAALNTH